MSGHVVFDEYSFPAQDWTFFQALPSVKDTSHPATCTSQVISPLPQHSQIHIPSNVSLVDSNVEASPPPNFLNDEPLESNGQETNSNSPVVAIEDNKPHNAIPQSNLVSAQPLHSVVTRSQDGPQKTKNFSKYHKVLLYQASSTKLFIPFPYLLHQHISHRQQNLLDGAKL